MRGTRIKALVSALAAIALVAGCGNSSGPTIPAATKQVTTAVPSTGTDTTASPSAVATSAALSGIVIQTCLHGNGRMLSFVNPTTGAIAATRIFNTGDYEPEVGCTPIARGRDEQRSSYNMDFSLVAAQKKLADGGFHTGVVSAATSEQDATDRFVDLSGVNENGFGSEAQQSVGAFNPKNGLLYFVSKDSVGKNHLMTVAPTVGSSPKEITAPTEVQQVGIEMDYPYNFGVYFSLGYAMPLFEFDSYQVTASDGSWAFWDAGNGIAYGKPGTGGTLMAGAPTPWIYLNKDSYIGVNVNGGELLQVTASGATAHTKSLLPVTDGLIKSPMLSPDGRTIAFILDKPASRTLYTVPVGGGAPVKVMDLDLTVMNLGIIDWL